MDRKGKKYVVSVGSKEADWGLARVAAWGVLSGMGRARGSRSVTTAGRRDGKQAGSWERQECHGAVPAGRDRQGMLGQERQD